MHVSSRRRHARRGDHGQIIVVAALSMIAIIGGVSLVIEGGNAYAHQRIVQNATDAVANSGATTLAERLGGTPKTDADVFNALQLMSNANALDTNTAYYTNVYGQMLTPLGVVTNGASAAARVGDGVIPPTTQGVRVSGSQVFGTTFAGALGITSFTASADATAITGPLTGGLMMPVVFPVSTANCDGSGDTVSVDDSWRMSNPGDPPDGQEWNVPLCMSGAGSFMILDLDPNKDCYQEVVDPTPIQWNDFPVWVNTDTGNDCAKKVAQGIADANLNGTIVNIPICDNDCSTTSGSGGQYHIVRVVSFYLDYISYSNNVNNSACRLTTSPNYPGSTIINITGGNGSASCMVGWFVRYITNGPVGTGAVEHGEALGIQLIR